MLVIKLLFFFTANEFRCSECSKLLPTERLLREHLRYHRMIHTCPHCPVDEEGRGKTFSNTNALNSHIAYCHSDARPFPCTEPDCKYSAKSQTDLSKHLEVHANTLWYYCEVSQLIKLLSVELINNLLTLGKRVPIYGPQCCYTAEAREKRARAQHGAAVRVPHLQAPLLLYEIAPGSSRQHTQDRPINFKFTIQVYFSFQKP